MKSELSEFAEDLSPEEIRSAVLMGLLGFVIYPILPDRFIDRWQLINPRQTWVTVIVLAGIGFINYVLLRIDRTRGCITRQFSAGWRIARPRWPSSLLH